MADYTLATLPRFPEGTTVTAYLARGQAPSDSGPHGSAVDTQVVANGRVTFANLTVGERYIAFGFVGGEWKRIRFAIDAPPHLPVYPDEDTIFSGDIDFAGGVDLTKADVEPPLGSTPQGDNTDLGERLSALEASLAAARTNQDALTASLDDTLLPSLHIYKDAAQSITSGGSAQAVNFNQERHKVGITWDPGPPATVTIQSPGWYEGLWSAQFAGGSLVGIRTLQVKKNGTTVIAEDNDDPMADNSAKKLNLTFREYLAKNDTLQFMAFQTSGGAMNVGVTPNTSPEMRMNKVKHVGPPDGSSGSGSSGGGTFSALPAPPAWYPTSIFNTPIASLGAPGNTVHPNSAAMIADMFTRGPAATGGKHVSINEYSGRGGTPLDFSHPVYVATGSDPQYTIHGTNYQNETEGNVVYLPAGARPPGGSDFSIGVIQPDGIWEYDFWNITSIANGQIVAGFVRKVRIDQTGLGNVALDRGGITSARFAHGLGIIRVDELTDNIGGGSLSTVQHALFAACNTWNGRVAPGVTGIAKLGTGENRSLPNAPAQGQHIRLKASYNVAGSGFPLWKKRILKAMQDYGCYIGDNGGASFNIHLESEVPYQAFGRSPTCLEYLDSQFSHTPSTQWDLDTGVDWPNQLEVLNPPS
jgi:hypothetical protein